MLDPETCEACDGTGEIGDGDGGGSWVVPCAACDGGGELDPDDFDADDVRDGPSEEPRPWPMGGPWT